MTAPTRPSRTLHITTAVLPLAGWTVHAVVMHRRLAAAGRDPLTGALRRDGFTARAQRLVDRHDDTAVLIADLDHFKQLNDRLGHTPGDSALAAVAARLMEWAGPRGVVGRLGGDEFAVATRISPRHRDLRIEQLGHLLALPVPIEGEPVHVGVSVGAATAHVTGTADLSALLRTADTAMYAGKHTGIPVQARPGDPAAPSVNGRRAGRPGTSTHAIRSAA
ncbi:MULTISPECIES: GGDEF domain-containing protein [unclassified Streptomyces]|uniref:GGDEF domain-containing protein n=1 Tax=unclassified Streptomyces TaxID=2593676 RepID=UPI00081ED448|nr:MULTISPECIES: GGDEF domain-containing protein [unclassified Streptomyces]MYZ34349.1 diguanylate cyclase [Streptomyces sp. SID4917]SCF66666.1 diguanylate cyclase (GGDEF) domain-containing protein [Streptomyces sp. MnatMP-M17]